MGFQKGNKLGGRKKRADGLDLQKIFLQGAPEAIRVVFALLKSYDDPTRMRAAVHILDRALGKVKESMEVTGKDGGPIQAVVNFGIKPKE